MQAISARFHDRLAGLAGWRADLAAAGLGALSAAALPPVYAIPVLLVAVPGLLALVDGARGWPGALRRGFFFGLCHHMIGLYWITEAILIESARYWWLVPLAVPALSALMALFIAVPCAGARMAVPGWHRVLLFGGLWTLADLARQFLGTGFPWNPWGSVWAIPGPVGDVLIQPAAWIGVPGMTLLTVLLAATPALGWRWCAGGVAMMAGWAAFGVHRLERPTLPVPGVSVVLVQGNVPQDDKWDRTIAAGVFERYLRLTHDGVAAARRDTPNQPVVVVWPETASPYALGQDPGARAAIWQAAVPATAVLAGSIRFDAAREPYNSMFVLTGPDTVGGYYDKWHLVPFGEFPPSWVPFSVQIVPGHLAFGTGPKTLHVDGLPPFGGLICYEAIYPGQLVEEADRPDWLVNITNDAWFGDSSGPRQHLAAARLRAVEEGLPLMRAANTGITAAFDAFGREVGRMQSRVAEYLVVGLPPACPRTPFSRLGLGIPLLLSLGSCGVGIRLVKKRDRPRASDDKSRNVVCVQTFSIASLTIAGCSFNHSFTRLELPPRGRPRRERADWFMADQAENRASPVDVHVGARIRLRRTLMGMSQERLGDALGLTFQQVQKYERGTNRVGASRLFDLSRILDVPISFFYDNMPESMASTSYAPATRQLHGFAEQQDSFGTDDVFTRRETLELIRAYYGITDPNVRKRMLDLIKSMGPSENTAA